MDGLYIKKNEGISLEAGIESVGSLRLLAQAGGLEVMRQSILKGATVWITPAEDVETLEFFYILSGALEMKVDGSPQQLAAGDSFYVHGLPDELLIRARQSTELLYITNRPLFDSLFGFQDDLTNLLRQIDEKDHYTYAHSVHVMCYSAKILEQMALDGMDTATVSLDTLMVASLFHDIGKCFVPDEILKKRQPLTKSEQRFIVRHPMDSARILKQRFDEKIVEIARNHHERLDGSGYPFGLIGDEISVEARMIGVADSFDAMTTDRGYNRQMGCLEAAEELYALKDRYDRRVTGALLTLARSGALEEIRKGDGSARP